MGKGPPLNLAFDINSAKCGGASRLEGVGGLAGQDDDSAVAVLKEVLAAVIQDELGSIGVRLEKQFISNEAKRHIRLVSVGWLAVCSLDNEGGGGEHTPCKYCTEQRGARGQQTCP